MESTDTMVHTFNLRELHCQDEDGGQVVLRVDDRGQVVCAGIFDRHGAKLEAPKEGIELHITLKCPDKKDVILARCLRCYPDGHGGMYCIPC